MNGNNFNIKIGTNQDNRQLKALNLDYVKVDERSFEDLLVFSWSFSRLLNYYNGENQPDGDWSHFLTDEAVILASIIDADPLVPEKRFKDNLQKTILFLKPAKKIKYLKKCFDEIFQLARKFDYWYRQLQAVEEFNRANSSIRNEISSAIGSKLGPSFRKFRGLDELISRDQDIEDRVGMDYSGFDEIWQLYEIEEQNYGGVEPLKKRIEFVADRLSQIFQGFFETLLYLNQKAPDYLKSSLQTDNHYPEVALFISFIKLFRENQENLNQFTRRHLEFYFHNILHQQPIAPKADKVYLNFIPDETVPFSDVKKGTLFLAGEDPEGNEVRYAADNDLRITHGKISALKSVFIPNKSLNVRGREKKIASRVMQATIPLEGGIVGQVNGLLRKTYPTFGEDQAGKSIHERTMDLASVGFAISSPALKLAEGQREVTVTFHLFESAFKKFEKHLEDLAFADSISENEVFIKSFLEAFDISLSCEEGWFTLSRYVATRNNLQNTISIKFTLGNEDPPVVNFNNEIHRGKYGQGLPVIRFELNSNAYTFVYSLLNEAVLERISFHTSVKGVKNLLLHNDMGLLSANNPFFPFGPMPHVGSYLLIGSSEVFNKSLDELSLDIEWFDLPRHQSGFFGHYHEYKADVDNESFKAKISVLDGGRWVPEPADQQEFTLFSTVDRQINESPAPQSELQTRKRIDSIDIKSIKQPAYYQGLNEELIYRNTAQRGFLKLELSSPGEGFMHSLYPNVLSQITIDNSRTGFFRNAKKKPMPHTPYSPQIKSLSLNYSSSSVMNIDNRSQNNSEGNGKRGMLYHIHPFGESVAFPDTSKQEIYLLPEMNYEGSLMIGLSRIHPPETITMLFEMLDEYTITSEEDPPVIEWSYLCHNEWRYLSPSRIVRDETKGFLKTGIIAIELPGDITKGNTLLDGGLYWVRAAAKKNHHTASKIVSVTQQVLTATLAPQSMGGSHLDEPLPAKTITRSLSNIQGVRAINQPLESFGGIHGEKPEEFYTRVGERLRHKSRAVTAWDFERIVLDKFPAIYKVTCLSGMNSMNLDAPGNVLLVVTPYTNQLANPYEPMASSELLYDIKRYLQSAASSHLKLEVRNPHYERIKIMCSVKFAEGYNYGYYLQKLNEEINRYLIGDLNASRRNLQLGGKVNSSDILSFMRTLPYVDFITEFSMIQAAWDLGGKYVLLDTAREGDERPYLQATKPWSVLVPAQVHQIKVLNETTELHSKQAGIDSLELGYDFIIE
ncbi:baseplate J/gp47 family protein [Roseivirga sp. BDSF3-8]|uniref:baseplate J/gp47 family protein n=1 Tax=Roseivirga sp. BDSF3-8 TaxID=3241598 RepID=UPI0035322FF1